MEKVSGSPINGKRRRRDRGGATGSSTRGNDSIVKTTTALSECAVPRAVRHDAR